MRTRIRIKINLSNNKYSVCEVYLHGHVKLFGVDYGIFEGKSLTETDIKNRLYRETHRKRASYKRRIRRHRRKHRQT
jgi:hypothetical protein